MRIQSWDVQELQNHCFCWKYSHYWRQMGTIRLVFLIISTLRMLVLAWTVIIPHLKRLCCSPATSKQDTLNIQFILWRLISRLMSVLTVDSPIRQLVCAILPSTRCRLSLKIPKNSHLTCTDASGGWFLFPFFNGLHLFSFVFPPWGRVNGCSKSPTTILCNDLHPNLDFSWVNVVQPVVFFVFVFIFIKHCNSL